MKLKELLNIYFGDIRLLVKETVCPADENICDRCEWYDPEEGCTTEWLEESREVFIGKIGDTPLSYAECKIDSLVPCSDTSRKKRYPDNYLKVTIKE